METGNKKAMFKIYQHQAPSPQSQAAAAAAASPPQATDTQMSPDALRTGMEQILSSADWALNATKAQMKLQYEAPLQKAAEDLLKMQARLDKVQAELAEMHRHETAREEQNQKRTAKIKALKASLAAATATNTSLSTNVDDLKKELANLKQQFAKRSDEQSKVQKENKKLSKRLESQSRSITHLQAEIDLLKKTKETLKEEMNTSLTEAQALLETQLQEKLKLLKKQETQTDQKLTLLNKQEAELQRELALLTTELGRARKDLTTAKEFEVKLEQERIKLQEANAAISELRVSSQRLQTDLNTTHTKKTESARSIDALKKELTALKQTAAQLHAELAAVRAKENAQTTRLSDLEKRLYASQAKEAAETARACALEKELQNWRAYYTSHLATQKPLAATAATSQSLQPSGAQLQHYTANTHSATAATVVHQQGQYAASQMGAHAQQLYQYLPSPSSPQQSSVQITAGAGGAAVVYQQSPYAVPQMNNVQMQQPYNANAGAAAGVGFLPQFSNFQHAQASQNQQLYYVLVPQTNTQDQTTYGSTGV